jgi:hypothetical protein
VLVVVLEHAISTTAKSDEATVDLQRTRAVMGGAYRHRPRLAFWSLLLDVVNALLWGQP